MRQRLPSGARTLAGVAAAALAATLGAGCQARTVVAVTDGTSGSGSVAVTVTLDKAADTAIGGLAGQLDTAGLAAQGWAVGPVRPAAGGGATVTATHPFATPAGLARTMASIAGSSAEPVFALSVVPRPGFWQDRTAVTGRVDLSCGVGCFGDAALRGRTGSPIGFDPARASATAGTTAAQSLAFQVTLQLPGSLTGTDATSRAGGQLVWQPRLGATLPIDATTRTWNTTHLVGAAAAAAAAILVAAAGLGILWRRRRRSRGAAPGAPSGPTRAGRD